MIVSTKGRYALRMMIALAKRERGNAVSLKELAKEEDIPYKYLENMAALLMRANLIEGTRGKTGGYRLVPRPEECTAAQILSVTETSLAAVSCTEKGAAECPKAARCPTLPLWRELDCAVNGVLSRYTLADLL